MNARRTLFEPTRARVVRGALAVIAALGVLELSSHVIARPNVVPDEGCALLRRTLRFDAAYMSAVLEGKPTMSVLLAARTEHVAAVGAAIEAVGGRVDRRVSEVGYLRVTLPTSAVPVVACNGFVDALEGDAEMGVDDLTQRLPPLQEPRTSDDATARVVEPRPATARGIRATPRRRPITVPLQEMGVDEFLKAHPTFDGRGITIGFIEWVPDLLDVETWAAPGRSTTILRPLFEWPATPHQAVVGLRAATLRGTLVMVNGQGYQLPPKLSDREMFVGAIDERRLRPYYGGDLNRDGNPSGANPYVGVLRDPVTHEVWIDVQQNRDWTDDVPFVCGHEPPLTLGRDNPGTAARDSMAVWVLCDANRPADVLVVPTAFRHMTTLAATAVAAALPLGGHGVAPGARLLPVLQLDIGYTSTLIEAALLGFRDPRVDVLTLGLTAQRRLHDGHSVAPLVLDRGVRRYNKLLFSAMGNGPIGLETLSEAAGGREVLSVGAYTSPETLAATHGIADRDPGGPYWLGLHGPRADGLLKPDLVATAAAYVPTSSAWLASRPGSVSGPRGFRPAWGTSLSAPAAASAAALLLSGARQTGGNLVSAAALRAALLAGAQRLPRYKTVEQGAGLLWVPGAWDALQRGVQQRAVDVQAPVGTRMADSGDVSTIGPGLFERESWTTRDLGTRRTRSVVLTRRDGTARPERFRIAVLGDQDTFNVSQSTVSLPLDTPVTLSVQVAPRRAGLHAAIVRLTEVAGGRAWADVPLTVVVAHEVPDAGEVLTLRGTIAFSHFDRHFIHVPLGLGSGTVKVSAEGQAIRPRLLNPAGQAAPTVGTTARGQWQHTIDRPEQGVWELVLSHAEGVSTGMTDHEQPPPATYSVTVRGARDTQSSSQRETDVAAAVVRGIVDGGTSFVRHDFYVAQPDATLTLASELSVPSSCQAEHRLILERYDGTKCVPAIGSETSARGTTLTVPHVGVGMWRGVVWRTTPAVCAQEIRLTIAVSGAHGEGRGEATLNVGSGGQQPP